MAQTFTGRKRVRKFFGKIQEVAEMPNLIEVQKASYDQFLMVAMMAPFRRVVPAVSQRQARERQDGADVYRSEARTKLFWKNSGSG
jgi:DNA-directed RNA polymerase beta subunit